MTKRAVARFHPETGIWMGSYESMTQAVRETGVSRDSIRMSVKNAGYLGGGFIWTDMPLDIFVPPTREQIKRIQHQKKSCKKIGRTASATAIEKIRQANTGKTHSKETCDQLAVAGKNKWENTPKPVYQYTLPDLHYVAMHKSVKSAAKHAGVTPKTLRQVLSDKCPSWITANNYHWSHSPPDALNKQPIRTLLLESSRFQNTLQQ